MEARVFRVALLAAAASALGASYRTTNFIVEAPTQEMARQIGDSAEKYRRELAIEWLGSPMRNWAQPCPITAQVGPHLGAGGATSFVFDRGEVFGWQMNIQGSQERILDSVLPHEVTHTVFATHFRQPLPRWADEGACTTVEHPSEKMKQQRMLIQFLQTGRGIAFSKMFAMKEYPRDVMPLYSQGYSLARYLIEQGGNRKFIAYVGDGLKRNEWTQTTHRHYGFDNLAALQDSWLQWVRQGSPRLAPTAFASDSSDQRSNPDLIYRGQSADQSSPPEQLIPLRRVNQTASNSTGADRKAAQPDFRLTPAGPDNDSDWRPTADAAAATSGRPRGQSSSIYAQGSRGATIAPGSPPSTTQIDYQNKPTEGSPRVILEWSRTDAAKPIDTTLQ